jgi:hypothetical protein
MAFAILVLNSTFYAQSVSISSNSGLDLPAPATFKLTAIPSVSVQSVVFYRNDVPFSTDSTSAYELNQTAVGQETYTYRARAYINSTTWVDSPSLTVTVRTPLVLRMGETVPTPSPNPSPTATPTPKGPDRTYDHTNYIKHAIKYLSDNGGGTLYFPCSGGTWNGNPDLSIYNISSTIEIPSNVTLQGDSAEEGIYTAQCRIYWNDSIEPANVGCTTWSTTDPLGDKPMFKILGGEKRVRFRDLWIISRVAGRDCPGIGSETEIANDDNAAFLLDAGGGSISDVIFENVTITGFTYGIRTIGNSVSDVRMRGVRPLSNDVQLSIKSTYAYDWDVQNFNIGYLGVGQSGVEIDTQRPSSYSGENGKLKFLQLNCQGNAERTSELCLDITKHGGLYFKQLHIEGLPLGIRVNPTSATNEFPIVMEGSGVAGKFYDDSMDLYMIGNGILGAPERNTVGQDNGRLEFYGDGLSSTVVDCGDIFVDRTDTLVSDSNPNNAPKWEDWRMSFTHTERNRASFYIPLTGIALETLHLDKPHTVCPEGDIKTSAIGGEFFDNGVLPVEPSVYTSSQIFDSSDCGFSNDCGSAFNSFLANAVDRRTLVIQGVVSVKQTVAIPRGRQIVGIPNGSTKPQIDFTPASGIPLFDIAAPITTNLVPRTTAITIRDLKMVQTNSQTGTHGIRILGENDSLDADKIGIMSDVHLSGLTFQGFATGFYAGHNGSNASPQLDGVSLKNFKFIDNQTSVRLDSQNASNWNINTISMTSNSNDAEGWDQKSGGSSLQSVTCEGTSSYDMKDCVRLHMSNMAVTGLNPTKDVANVVTIKEGSILNDESIYEAFQTSSLLIRHSDLRTGDAGKYSMNLRGKAFIVSMNNKYDYFTEGASTDEGELSRVTSCDDSGGGSFTSVLEPLAKNNYIGLETPTLTVCGADPVAWEDDVKWGVDGDIPLVGNFYDDVKDDYVVFRTGATYTHFYIRESQGTQMRDYQWGLAGDKPLTGRFFAATQKSQITVFRPSNGSWWMKDLDSGASSSTSWGLSTDIPIVGNFFSESGGAANQRDEIAIYRPSTQTFWVMNPRSGYYEVHYRTVNTGNHCNTDCSNIQVGDFLDTGYEQVAHFKNGNWYVLDLDNGAEDLLSFSVSSGDIPVAGKYFDEGCTQLGVWTPSAQTFTVQDPQSSCSSGGTRDGQVEWGLSYGSSNPNDFDLPLVMNNSDGLARPTALRRIAADPVFTFYVTKHRWWVHDPITPNP